VHQNQRIKLGVTLYSFQDEYVWGKLTLEDCLAELHKMGTEGIETIGFQQKLVSPIIASCCFLWLTRSNLMWTTSLLKVRGSVPPLEMKSTH
jgi:hypothetical protein